MQDLKLQEVLISLVEKLSVIEDKVLKSEALNGGFDKLSETVKDVSTDVKSIKSAMYEPDRGLFSRVKELEMESARRMDYIIETKPIVGEHQELVIWKKHAEKELDQFEKLQIEFEKLKEWKVGTQKIIWLLATAAGGMWIKHFMDMLMK